ncbi:hypothetical protein TWF281_004080 [Arthrobotrys megalospora]
MALAERREIPKVSIRREAKQKKQWIDPDPDPEWNEEPELEPARRGTKANPQPTKTNTISTPLE